MYKTSYHLTLSCQRIFQYNSIPIQTLIFMKKVDEKIKPSNKTKIIFRPEILKPNSIFLLISTMKAHQTAEK